MLESVGLPPVATTAAVRHRPHADPLIESPVRIERVQEVLSGRITRGQRRLDRRRDRPADVEVVEMDEMGRRLGNPVFVRSLFAIA